MAPARSSDTPAAGINRAVTSNDVARLAGVSQSAVSRAFTPGTAVSERMRVKVFDAARMLGYRPNAIARSLITKRSRMIGVVVSYLENQFYPLVIEGLSKRLREHGYHVLLFCTDSQDADELLPEILPYQIDGLVMASTRLSSAVARRCAEAGIPVVLFNRTVAGGPSSTVAADNAGGGRSVADLLCRAGHTRIAFMAGLEDTSTSREREQGFLQGLAAHRQRCFARAVGDYRFDTAEQATLSLFGSDARPDAVFVANDHMAIAAMDTLRLLMGLRVPHDVSVVGFDDVPQAAWRSYRLTTVRQPARQMIDATVALVLAQAAGGQTQAVAQVLPTELVLRDSARLPPSP
ncbi:MAG: LacI family DNA-binding transcriptional regulator [Pseudomonadota bacterium]|nr:LacI family DNA-binding transcriptional regulator [Pseudomonadota bacterium]